MPSVANSFSTSRSSRIRTRGGRQRQYNVRLRLPLEICMSVAKQLFRLFCSKQDQIPTAGKLVICKVQVLLPFGLINTFTFEAKAFCLKWCILKFLFLGVSQDMR